MFIEILVSASLLHISHVLFIVGSKKETHLQEADGCRGTFSANYLDFRIFQKQVVVLWNFFIISHFGWFTIWLTLLSTWAVEMPIRPLASLWLQCLGHIAWKHFNSIMVCNFPLSGIKPLLVGFRLFDENDTATNDINKVKWIDCAVSMKPLLCRIREAMSRLAYLSSGIGCGEWMSIRNSIYIKVRFFAFHNLHKWPAESTHVSHNWPPASASLHLQDITAANWIFFVAKLTLLAWTVLYEVALSVQQNECTSSVANNSDSRLVSLNRDWLLCARVLL